MQRPEPWRKPTVPHWIALGVGLYLVFHYYCLHDDAFLYFRYIDNLLFLKVGLVYNAGEYVEGFSSPLFTFLLGVVRAFSNGYGQILLAIGLTSFALFWICLWKIECKLADDGRPFGAVSLFLCTNYAVDSYFASGHETPLILLSAAGYALYVLHPGSRWLQVWLAAMPLLRHELIVPVAWAALSVYLITRRPPWTFLVTSAIALAALAAFRIYYYADLLPNTFYLKDDVDIGQGFVFLHDTLASYHVYWIAGISLLILVTGLRRSPERVRPLLRQRGILLVGALLPTLYVVKIGGGYLHFRYLAFSFCVLLIGLAGIVDLPIRRRLPTRQPALRVVQTIAGIAVVAFSVSLAPRCLSTHPYFIDAPGRSEEKQACTRSVGLFDLAAHRAENGRLQPWFWQLGDAAFTQALKDSGKARRSTGTPFYRDVRVGWVCQAHYFNMHDRIIHSWALSQPVLARMNMSDHWYKAHSPGLLSHAQEIRDMERHTGIESKPGLYRRALELGVAPPWVAENAETLELIEAKMYNRHDFLENVHLALRLHQRIDP